MAGLDDDEYEVPLRDQRYFGAGIKRKGIKFVPSTSKESGIAASLPTTPSSSAADKYLSIVLKQASASNTRAASSPPQTAGSGLQNESTGLQEDGGKNAPEADSRNHDDKTSNDTDTSQAMCQICDRPIYTSAPHAHESTIAHQVRLQHSHPPSHLDRTRKGLVVLQTHGWDPDARLGLGADGEGMLHPIKAKENPKRQGLGAKVTKAVPVEKAVKVDAGVAKAQDAARKKKAESLRNAFYRSEEVEKYLGSQDEVGSHIDLSAFKRAKRGR